jgi:hypothetical protein
VTLIVMVCSPLPAEASAKMGRAICSLNAGGGGATAATGAAVDGVASGAVGPTDGAGVTCSWAFWAVLSRTGSVVLSLTPDAPTFAASEADGESVRLAPVAFALVDVTLALGRVTALAAARPAAAVPATTDPSDCAALMLTAAMLPAAGVALAGSVLMVEASTWSVALSGWSVARPVAATGRDEPRGTPASAGCVEPALSD